MYHRNLNEEQEDRLLQAARALMAAAYEPITFPASWPDVDQLSPMAFERLMKITRAAVGCVPGGSDEDAAFKEMNAASQMRS